MPAEFRKALKAAQGAPVEILDGDQHYVLIWAEVYEQLKSVLDLNESGPQERLALMQAWGKRAGWEDPDASVFDDLKPL